MNQDIEAKINYIIENKKRNWTLMVPSSIGEVAIVCSLCKSFMEKHGGQITLVIREEHLFVASCFKNLFNEIITLPLEVIRSISNANFIPKNSFSIEYPITIFPPLYGDQRTGEIYDRWISSKGRSGLNLLDLYRFLLRLDWNCELVRPVIPYELDLEVADILGKCNLRKNNTVIFHIGTNTNKPIPDEIWATLYEKYKENGFEVVVNKMGAMFYNDCLKLPEAIYIDIPLKYLVPINKFAGHVVTTSTGACLFSILCNVEYKMKLLLPSAICIDYEKLIFRNVDPITGSNFLNFNEAVIKSSNYCEFLPPLLDKKSLNTFASDVFDGGESLYKYSPSVYNL